MPNNDKTNEFNEPDDEEIPRSARFKATRAILNAQTQAKITDGSFQSRMIVCKLLPHGMPKGFGSDMDEKDGV